MTKSVKGSFREADYIVDSVPEFHGPGSYLSFCDSQPCYLYIRYNEVSLVSHTHEEHSIL